MSFLLDMIKPPMVGSAVRHVLTAFAGMEAFKGFATQDEWSVVIGGVAMLATLLWSRFAKRAQGVLAD